MGPSGGRAQEHQHDKEGPALGHLVTWVTQVNAAPALGFRSSQELNKFEKNNNNNNK